MLYGRQAESARIDQLLCAARGGHSGVLVLRGDQQMIPLVPGLDRCPLPHCADDTSS